MSTWDREILSEEVNTEFLDDIADSDVEDIEEAIADAVVLGNSDTATDDEFYNGLAAATIVAIWAGAPYSAGEIIENYPFIRDMIGTGEEELREKASELLESADTELDLEVYIEALS
ncbi:hypothetical protein P4N68_04065 [Corynebacterium felinum]|uniref:DUF4259 domain-containing protein n=1 Tax=Corynebacterium felinum TaxID=131318 RepID=A0ABU2B8F2_9CORY|nr:DUF4259 domain-containing protein [Corynebacterium felinum]MDF5820261.1 hypothetical protein [Corynebacterium felinum]MDR7354905.1 hypothetical protein [Corynebacterium felinum]WJY94265.1 hypothetical protein CFELI_03115 [Corynebacterium felinum]